MNQATKQSGMALIVAMILLAIMTILGMSAGRTSSIQERMSANFLDRSSTFQIAQEALKFAESQIDTNVFNVKPTASDCALGILHDYKDDAEERFRDGNFNCWNTVAGNIAQIGAQPQYYIELLGSNQFVNNAPCSSNQSAPATCDVYRITVCSMPARDQADNTACSNPATNQSVVYLRSIYLRKQG